MNFKKNYPLFLLIIFFIFAIVMGIDPVYRYVWFVENIILLLFIPVIVISYKYFKFSNTSYILMFLFVIMQLYFWAFKEIFGCSKKILF